MTGKSTAIVRLLVAVLMIANFALVQNGIAPIEIDEALLTEVVSGILAFGSLIWAWWKNTPWTKEAQAADGAMKQMKNKPVPRDEAKAMADKGVKVENPHG